MSETIEITLYGYQTGNGFRAAIALEEANIRYTVKRVELSSGEQRTPEFLAMNPRGKIPVVVVRHEDGRRFVLTQSNAIMMFADELSPGKLLPVNDLEARARAFERYFYYVTDVIVPSHVAATVARVAGQESALILTERSIKALNVAEQFLSESSYIAGDQFTLADIAAFTFALKSHAEMDWGSLPHMKRWYDRIAAREGVRRGLRAFEDPA